MRLRSSSTPLSCELTISWSESSSSSSAGRPCARPSRPEPCSPAVGSPDKEAWACRVEGNPAPWPANEPAPDDNADADEHGAAYSATATAIPSRTPPGARMKTQTRMLGAQDTCECRELSTGPASNTLSAPALGALVALLHQESLRTTHPSKNTFSTLQGGQNFEKAWRKGSFEDE